MITGLVSGLVKPGDRVDVQYIPDVLSGDPRMGNGTVMTLIKAAKVLAINGNTHQTKIQRGANTVTLELTQKQANVANLAAARGQLNLIGNPDGEPEEVLNIASDDRTTMDEILNFGPQETPKPPFTVEQYRGGGRSLVLFDENGNRLPYPNSGTTTDSPFGTNRVPGGNGTFDTNNSRYWNDWNGNSNQSPYSRPYSAPDSGTSNDGSAQPNSFRRQPPPQRRGDQTAQRGRTAPQR